MSPTYELQRIFLLIFYFYFDLFSNPLEMRGCLDYPNGLHEGVLDDHADIVAGVALRALSQVLRNFIISLLICST